MNRENQKTGTNVKHELRRHEKAYVISSGDGAVGVEPRVEVVGRPKHFRQQEVEKRPKLVKVVLQRCSRQQQSVCRLEFANDFRQFGFLDREERMEDT